MIRIAGNVSVNDIYSVAQDRDHVSVDTAVIEAVSETNTRAQKLIHLFPTYGRTTGVGANRNVSVDEGDSTHGLRLLRSHTVDAGDQLSETKVRAMLTVRLAQLSSARSGIQPDVLLGLQTMLNDDALPKVLEFGSIGTGDTSALAATALTLMGELPATRALDSMPSWGTDSALSFMSSSALTIGRACLAVHELSTLLNAGTIIFALSFLGLRGNRSPHSAIAAQGSGSPAIVRVSSQLRALLGDSGQAALIQDPYALRAYPEIQSTLVEASEQLHTLLSASINVAQENPLFAENDVIHHGGFYQSTLALKTDCVNIALAQSIPTLLSRIRMMTSPAYSGQTAFLASGPQGASGVMMIEYAAAAAYGEIRASATPSSLTTAVVSQGAEEDASFAPQAITQLERAIKAYRVVLSSELVVATRLLRQRELGRLDMPSDALRKAFDIAQELPTGQQDRELRADLYAADAQLAALARCS